MLRSLKDLERYQLSATDGDIGTVEDFLMDDRRWVVRYLVARTGTFFDERNVLLSPISFRRADAATQRFHLALTKEKIKHSPCVDAHQPVSRQYEREFYRYYGYPAYWGSAELWASGSSPAELSRGSWEPSKKAHDPADAHLRSAKQLCGYHVQGSDAEVGHVADFIVDDDTWAIRYLVLETSNWLFGKKILVAPHWATSVSWDERKLHLSLSREQIGNSPAWEPEAPVNREYELRLYDYYGRPVYWSSDEPPPAAKPARATEVTR